MRNTVHGVDVFSWNPRRPLRQSSSGSASHLRRRVNNFGDLLGPLIVRRMLWKEAVAVRRATWIGRPKRRLFAVGSVIHFANDRDVIWGSGVNGKIAPTEHRYTQLDVRAVRGPLTRSFLVDRGINVPEVYGDPALLLPALFPIARHWASRPDHEVLFVPNLNDRDKNRNFGNAIDPTCPLSEVVRQIARSEFVVASSLHGIIVAEALRIPARAIQSSAEPPFKYDDYYLGTGRSHVEYAATPADAVRMGPVKESPVWDSRSLMAAFPYDLWSTSTGEEA